MYSSRVSPQFNAEDADIHFKSSDNMLFFIHRESLKYSAASFLSAKTSEILELLFAFLYPKPLPDVKGLPFKTLAHLAEAAEKYQVFSAMTICNMRMTVVVKDHPLDVLRYAVIHHCKELIDIAAPLAMECPLPEAIDRLPPNTIAAWSKYYQQWLDASMKIYRPYCYLSCPNWNSPQHPKSMKDPVGGRVVLFNLKYILAYNSAGGKSCCHSTTQEWQYNTARIVNSIRPFSEFLYQANSSS